MIDTTTMTTTTTTTEVQRRQQHRAVSITNPLKIALLLLSTHVILATTTGLRGQHQRELLAVTNIKTTNSNSLASATAATANNNKQKVVQVTSMMKAENNKRKNDNLKKKKKDKSKSKKNPQQNQQQQQQQQQQNINQDNIITISVTKPTKIITYTKPTTTTTTSATATKATTTTTTTTVNTSVSPNIGMLPTKCTLSTSSSSDGTPISPDCSAQHFCKIELGTCIMSSSSSSSSITATANKKNKMLGLVNYGTCQPQPTTCSRTLNPVCGCNGITYNNECLAHSAGVSVVSLGNCPTTSTNNDTGGGGGGDLIPNIGNLPTKCILDFSKLTSSSSTTTTTCPEDQFCQVEVGSCSTSMSTTTTTTIAPGTCQPKPKLCTLMYDPVCGCDHRTYGSECAAQGVGMSVAYEGECTTTTDNDNDNNNNTPVIVPNIGSLPTKCTIDPSSSTSEPACNSPDQFCQLDTGACNSDSTTTTIDATILLTGTCQSKPSVCISVYNPVCGCDGRTYDSICSAHGAGMSVSYTGVCDGIITTTPATLVDKKDDDDDDEVVLYNMFEGPCTSDTQCNGGLVCHIASSTCVCNESTNEGCPIAGQLCGITPGLYCDDDEMGGGEGGCLPTCTCDYTSPFPAIFTDNETTNSGGDATTSNGCEVGEVCRMPCAMADAGPSCFASEIERDCRSGYVCVDGNGDGIINQNDGGKGCTEAEEATTTTTTTATLATIATVPVQELPCRIAGHCRSPSGVCEPPVACIADPCGTAICAANYVCEANYCGGCHANCVLADS